MTGYSVFAGRSRSPLGPFVDKEGVSLLASRTGGSIVVTPNGNYAVLDLSASPVATLMPADDVDWFYLAASAPGELALVFDAPKRALPPRHLADLDEAGRTELARA